MPEEVPTHVAASQRCSSWRDPIPLSAQAWQESRTPCAATKTLRLYVKCKFVWIGSSALQIHEFLTWGQDYCQHNMLVLHTVCTDFHPIILCKCAGECHLRHRCTAHIHERVSQGLWACTRFNIKGFAFTHCAWCKELVQTPSMSSH